MPRLAFEGLEPCDGKLSCPVLRGLGAGNSPRLPGVEWLLRFLIEVVSFEASDFVTFPTRILKNPRDSVSYQN